MQYAIITLSGKQYKVKQGDIIETEKLDLKPGDKTTFENVLLIATDDNALIGTPYVKDATVKALVVEHTKGEKIRISKFKSKARYRRVTGSRQSLTRIKIEEIITNEKPAKITKTSGKTTKKA